MEVKKFYKEGNEYTLPITSGGGVENMVTTDTEQTITADKVFENSEVHIFDTDGNGTSLGQGAIRMDHGDTTFMIDSYGSTSRVANWDNTISMSEKMLQLSSTATEETDITLKEGNVDFIANSVTFRNPDKPGTDTNVLSIIPMNNDKGISHDTISSKNDIQLKVGANHLDLESSYFKVEAGDGDDACGELGFDGDGWFFVRGNERVAVSITQNGYTLSQTGHTKEVIRADWLDTEKNPKLTIGNTGVNVEIKGNINLPTIISVTGAPDGYTAPGGGGHSITARELSDAGLISGTYFVECISNSSSSQRFFVGWLDFDSPDDLNDWTFVPVGHSGVLNYNNSTHRLYYTDGDNGTICTMVFVKISSHVDN